MMTKYIGNNKLEDHAAKLGEEFKEGRSKEGLKIQKGEVTGEVKAV